MSLAFIGALVACNLESLLQWNERIKTKLLDEIRTLLKYESDNPIEFYEDYYDGVSCFNTSRKLVTGTNEYYEEFDKTSSKKLANIAALNADERPQKHSTMIPLAKELTSNIKEKPDNASLAGMKCLMILF